MSLRATVAGSLLLASLPVLFNRPAGLRLCSNGFWRPPKRRVVEPVARRHLSVERPSPAARDRWCMFKILPMEHLGLSKSASGRRVQYRLGGSATGCRISAWFAPSTAWSLPASCLKPGAVLSPDRGQYRRHEPASTGQVRAVDIDRDQARELHRFKQEAGGDHAVDGANQALIRHPVATAEPIGFAAGAQNGFESPRCSIGKTLNIHHHPGRSRESALLRSCRRATGSTTRRLGGRQKPLLHRRPARRLKGLEAMRSSKLPATVARNDIPASMPVFVESAHQNDCMAAIQRHQGSKRAPHRVLFVCLGNIFRLTDRRGVLRHVAAKEAPQLGAGNRRAAQPTITSAHRRIRSSQRAALRRGIDISGACRSRDRSKPIPSGYDPRRRACSRRL